MQPQKFSDAVTQLKRSQYFRLYALVALMSCVIITLVIILINGTTAFTTPKRTLSYKAPITSGAERLDPKEVWAEKFAIEHALQAKRLETLEKMLQALLKLNEQALSSEASSSIGTTNYRKQMATQSLPSSSSPSQNGQTQNLQDPLAATTALRENLQQDHLETLFGIDANKMPLNMANPAIGKQSTHHNADNQSSHHPGHGSYDSSRDKDATPTTAATTKPPRFRSKGMQRTSLLLTNSKSNKPLKTFDNTIPAGAFAGAVMVGGVDASTSIQASNDPRPVLLRITDHGTLPRKFKSDLCGCHVLAACYGDISSERVYMRLEKLTCTERKTGEVVEMTVNGYVAGEDGRAGLRGIVVDRAGESMRNAAIGGFLSGMGNFLSQAHNPVTFSPMSGLSQTNPMTNPEMLKFGAAKGASGALDKYAEFYIKRAEQMQPVIQVQAGRRVDIVITSGVAFENSAARGEMVRVNDQQRLSQMHSASDTTQKPVEAWLPNHQARGQEK